MMTLIGAVTTSVIINVTPKVIATTAPVDSSSSDSSSTVAREFYYKLNKHMYTPVCHYVKGVVHNK